MRSEEDSSAFARVRLALALRRRCGRRTTTTRRQAARGAGGGGRADADGRASTAPRSSSACSRRSPGRRGHRRAADRGQQGVLRRRQREGRHRRQVQGRARVQADTQYDAADDRAAVQRHQEPRRRVRPDARHGADARGRCRSSSTDKIVAAPASLDAFWVREQNLLPIGGPYQIQAINALDYYINEADGKGKNICALIQDDPYGEAGLQGVEFAAEKLGFEVAEHADVQARRQRLHRPDQPAAERQAATWCSSSPRRPTRARSGARPPSSEFAPRWIGQSPTWIDELGDVPARPSTCRRHVDRRRGHRVGRQRRSRAWPRWSTNVEECRPEQEPDYYFAFGYNQARAMTGAAREGRRAGRPVARGHHGGARGARRRSRSTASPATTSTAPAEERNPPRTSTIFEVDPDEAVRARHEGVRVRVGVREGVRVQEGRALNPG